MYKPFFQGIKDIEYAEYGTLSKLRTYSSQQYLLILAGDTPLLEKKYLQEFIASSMQARAKLSVLSMQPDNPFGYGRLVLKEQISLLIMSKKKMLQKKTKKFRLVIPGFI